MITFLLNQTEHSVSDLDPNTMLLDYLREHLYKTGSKEGCASGDCGACTVVVGEAGENGIQYSAINSCITPVGNIHGRQLLTVEDLKNGDKLHAVQQAMVDCHGSQCGFCTPGFVMSMFAYRKNHSEPSRASIDEALGGNLCRCTGYRPIIDAAVQMFEAPQADQFSASQQRTITALAAIEQKPAAVELQGNGKKYFSPDSATELARLMLEYPEARLIAGGTDLSLELTQFLKEIDVLIYTGRVKELKRIAEMSDSLEIGAAVTYSDAKDSLLALYPDLHELIDRLGSRQIRNQGSLGGNIANASPIGDMPPALIALGAQLVLRIGDTTRTVNVEDYFVSYKVTVLKSGEFIERIIIPKPVPNYQFKVYKISKRLEDDISASCGAFNIRIENGMVLDAVIAYGGMAEIPKRATHCEQALINQPWSEQTIDTAMAALSRDFSPISDFRASADYRLRVSQNLLRRLYVELLPNAKNVRVTQYA